MKVLATVAFVIALASIARAQSDFLTSDEADQIRLVQEPDQRIPLYLNFAKQRADLLDQLFAQNKVGRSLTIHRMLEQLTEIIETVDVVIDDAIRRKREITVLGDVAKVERDLLARLEKHRESAPSDIGRYKFVLDTAIDTLRDSADLAEEDLRTRVRSVEADALRERKERQSMLTPESKEEEDKAAEARKKEEDTKQKKRPTLFKKGETKGTEKK